MKTISVNLYEYKELSDKAKETARNWWLEGRDNQFEWDNMQEDAKNIGLKLKGRNSRDTMEGDFISSARECAEKIIKEHGKTCETFKTAKAFLVELKKADKEYKKTGSEAMKEEAEHDFLLSLCEDYRIMMDKEEEHQCSDEAIEEAMEANEYTFLEDGTRRN